MENALTDIAPLRARHAAERERMPTGSPQRPFARARLLIERHSPGTPDLDGLWGGFEPLIDLLLPQGDPVHRKGSKKPVYAPPFGLGIVADDGPDVSSTEVRAVRSTRTEAKTVVTVPEELGSGESGH